MSQAQTAARERRSRGQRKGRRAGRVPAVLCFTLFALAMGGGTNTALAEEACETATCLAQELVRKIPRGETIALVPFGPPNTAIPLKTAKMLHDGISSALYRKSNGRHRFVSKELVQEIWEFYQTERLSSDYQQFWNDRRVGVIVQCKDRGLRERALVLHCVASRVGEDSKLKGDVIGPSTVLVVEDRWFPYRYELSRLGIALAGDGLLPGGISALSIIDADAGQGTRLTQDIGRRLQGILEERFRARRDVMERQAAESRANRQPEDSAMPDRVDYELRGRFALMDKRSASLQVWLYDPARKRRFRQHDATINREWLPANTEAVYHTATVRIVVSAGLREADAKLAVRNLARAAVVAEALRIEHPKTDEIRDGAVGMSALSQALRHGIPADERFEGPWSDGDGRWRTTLRARVVKPGAVVRPALDARLSSDEVRAGAPIQIELASSGTVHVAAFAWGADGNVVRLYPHFAEPDPVVPANGRLRLPRDRRCPLASWPLERQSASHEAIIVIAAARRPDVARLAPPFCYDPGASRPGKPIPGSEFLNGLAAADLSHATVAVLPYRVTR